MEDIESISKERKAWEISSMAEIVVPPVSNMDPNPNTDKNLVDYYDIDIEYFKEKSFSYAPLPHVDKFYNIRKGEIEKIEKDQYIDEDTSLIEAIKKLKKYSFLLFPRPFLYLIDKEKKEIVSSGDVPLSPDFAKEVLGIETEKLGETYDICNTDEVLKNYPSLTEEILNIEKEKRTFEIIVISDLNKRIVKEAIYPYIIKLENKLGKKIKKHYEESTSKELLKKLNPDTIGNWKHANIAKTDVHISEYMNLSEMKKIIKENKDLYKECGFESKKQVENQLKDIVDLRNKVIKTNSTLVFKKKDVKQIVKLLEKIETKIQNISNK